MDEKAAAQAIALLKPLAEADRQKIVSAMSTIERFLSVEISKHRTVYFASAPARRHGLGSAAARHSLCAGIRLGPTL
jgi:hypothetical protein